MPIVQISLIPQSEENKAEMSRVITDEIHRITNIPKESIVIAFYESPAENFATNGILVSEKFRRMKKE